MRFAQFAVPSLEVEDGAITLDAVPATLTDAGAAAFGTYPSGEQLDPVSAVIPVTADCVTAAPAVAEEPADAAPLTTEDAASSSPEAPVWPWIAGGIGLLAVIVAAGVLIARRRGSDAGPGTHDD
ncbi:MAG: HtaA domain-containing protein [Micrococcales bacterium]|nr:HtaA domain-containing protein [Micrococcales bacterium]